VPAINIQADVSVDILVQVAEQLSKEELRQFTAAHPDSRTAHTKSRTYHLPPAFRNLKPTIRHFTAY
jgi:hypothetical protein